MSHPVKIKNCEQCRKPCEFVPSKAKPSSSEWYCPRCHKSYDVPEMAHDSDD